MMNQSCCNKVIIVTGASKGIGKAIAQRMACEGGIVTIVSRNEDHLQQAVSDIASSSGKLVDSIAADVTRYDTAAMVVEHVIRKNGRLDVLVNNAGGPRFGSLMDVTESDWDFALQLSLRSAVRFIREALPIMKGNNWGRIINVTSTIAKEPSPTMILSATSRAGLHALSKALSVEIASFGVTINTICPGGVLTDRLESLIRTRSEIENLPYEQLLQESQSGIPLGRFAKPCELAAYATFLCSEDAGYITGTCLAVDGGLTKYV